MLTLPIPPKGGHAFSTDLLNWHVSKRPAYNSTVHWSDGGSTRYERRERPQVPLPPTMGLAILIGVTFCSLLLHVPMIGYRCFFGMGIQWPCTMELRNRGRGVTLLLLLGEWAQSIWVVVYCLLRDDDFLQVA